MKVLAFGVVKEILGAATVEVQSAATVSALQARLEHQYPKLKELSSLMIAVNGAYAHADTVINEGDEVAIIPPVSGG